MVKHWAKSLSGWTATVSPSMATGSSMNSTPASAHFSSSMALMGREASLMSVSPLQNFLNPPPVPDIPITNRADPPMDLPQSSTMASDMGKTVLEPSMSVVSAPQAPVAMNRNPVAQKKAAPQAFLPGERLKIQFLAFIRTGLYDGY